MLTRVMCAIAPAFCPDAKRDEVTDATIDAVRAVRDIADTTAGPGPVRRDQVRYAEDKLGVAGTLLAARDARQGAKR